MRPSIGWTDSHVDVDDSRSDVADRSSVDATWNFTDREVLNHGLLEGINKRNGLVGVLHRGIPLAEVLIDEFFVAICKRSIHLRQLNLTDINLGPTELALWSEL